MTEQNIYRELSQRTGGACMLGVVGPVRTGKSTFIKRFMETLVIPGSRMPICASGRRMSCPKAARAAPS